jgi:cytochrome c biogenesis protein CcmG, thiol:disulfide interchange protein DsbE
VDYRDLSHIPDVDDTDLPEEEGVRARRLTVGRLLAASMLLLFLGAFLLRGARILFPSPIDRGFAPALTLTTFDGREIALSSLRGQPVVLNFWASWCGPCRSEAALLEKGWREYQDTGAVFLGVAINDEETPARAFLDEYAVTYPSGLDATGEWDLHFRVRGLPETFFIDREGRIVDHVSGPILSLADLERRIEAIGGWTNRVVG